MVENKLFKEIDINGDDISDVIGFSIRGMSKSVYKSLITGDEIKDISSLKTPFNIVNGNEIRIKRDNSRLRGVYAKHDKDNDILYIITAFFDIELHRWVEIERLCLYRENEKIFSRMLNLNHKDYRGFSYSYDYIDICGNFYHGNMVSNSFNGVTREVESFFHGPCVVSIERYEKAEIIDFSLPGSINELENAAYATSRDCNNLFIPYETFLTINEKAKLPDLPEEVYEDMRIFALNKRETKPDTLYIECIVSCIQNVNGDLYKRLFRASYRYESTDIIVEMREFERIKITKENNGCNFWVEDALLYVDDLKGTFLEYTGCYLKDAYEYFKKCLREDVYSCLQKQKEYLKSQELPCCKNLLPIVVKLASCPTVERFINAINNKRFRSKMFDLIYRNAREDLDVYVLNCFFGEIDITKKELHKIIGMPKGLLEYSCEEMQVGTALMIKRCFFINEEAKEYFRRMNFDDAKYLFDVFAEKCLKTDNIGMVVPRFINSTYVTTFFNNSFKHLMIIFGYKNWKNYLVYLNSLKSNSELLEYADYTENLMSLGDLAKDFKWNPPGDEINDANNELYNILSSVEEGQNTNMLNTKSYFDSMQSGWKKYSFQNDTYTMMWPKKASDVLEEGIKLNHCVKTFIPVIVSGKSTILFIRKKENPDKPYFTLEIRDGAIRQCHGFNNINADKDVNKFIRDFCKEKNVIYNDMGQLLAP